MKPATLNLDGRGAPGQKGVAVAVQAKDFTAYRREVDAIIWARVGLSYDDLPDLVSLADLFEDGVSARSAASRVIRAAKSEYGF